MSRNRGAPCSSMRESVRTSVVAARRSNSPSPRNPDAARSSIRRLGQTDARMLVGPVASISAALTLLWFAPMSVPGRVVATQPVERVGQVGIVQARAGCEQRVAKRWRGRLERGRRGGRVSSRGVRTATAGRQRRGRRARRPPAGRPPVRRPRRLSHPFAARDGDDEATTDAELTRAAEAQGVPLAAHWAQRRRAASNAPPSARRIGDRLCRGPIAAAVGCRSAGGSAVRRVPSVLIGPRQPFVEHAPHEVHHDHRDDGHRCALLQQHSRQHGAVDGVRRMDSVAHR